MATMENRTAQLDALLHRLSGKVTSPENVIAELCRIHREIPAKWLRFVAGAQINMPKLTSDDVKAIVDFVTA